ncbi:MAG TPA: cysteine dioxygenase family protein [Candidatus Eisenbacteria bacterium]|nr:cysteine dioxygenase family protein [Candidatus Eisenbacteria bacterium]
MSRRSTDEKPLSLADLIGFLRRTRVTRDMLIGALERLEVSESELRLHGNFCEDRYQRNTIVKEHDFEILLMCWKSGQRSLIHDHGTSLGGVKIVRGILTESSFALAPNGMIKPVGSTDYRAGDVQIEDRSTIHQVSNLQPNGCDAISLHVYVPPLAEMNIYRLYDLKVYSLPAGLHAYGSGI